MRFYSNTAKPKLAELNRRNWTHISQQNNWTTYQHKYRKKVLLKYDTKHKTGFFWDAKQNKPISPTKLIRWYK